MILALAALATAHAAEELRRFALLAGANDGGADRVRLRYAVDDARAVGEVLGQLGGVAPDDAVLLSEPGRGALIEAIGDVRGRVAAAESAGARTELVVYYSGHSDEEGMLLGDERFAWTELRRALDNVPADVRVVILDSCSSGSVVRAKGGKARPAFLVDESVDMRGTAFLTSSSADEAAQESDRLGASFFTHFLVSGLRGAADQSQDGRVTITEAYQFAYTETLDRTARTQAGPQHAAWDIRLAGTGDLVMTDVRATTAGLVADEAVDGRLTVRDGARRLVAELYKPAGRRVELGLSPGRYTVLVDRGGRLREASFTVAADGMVRLSSLAFTDVPSEVARARGDVPEPSPDAYVDVPYSLALTPSIAYHFPVPNDRQHFALSVTVADAAQVDGIQASFLANRVRDGATGLQYTTGMNLSGGPVDGVQVAAGANQARGRVRGAQIAAGVNVAAEDVKGFQVATVNVAGEGVAGVQVGAVNVAGGVSRGVSVAGVGVAEEVHGVQTGGVVLAKRVRGAQIGLVNVAGDVKGTQIGLVNLSGDIEGVPVGLLSYSRTGYNHVRAWMDAGGMANAGVTFGAKHVYTLVSAGVHVADPAALWTLQLGIGGHGRIAGPVYLDVEASAGNLGLGWASDGDVLLVGYLLRSRALVGVDVAKHFSVFLGPTFDVVARPGNEPLPTPAWVGSGVLVFPESDVTFPWQAGAALGVRF